MNSNRGMVKWQPFSAVVPSSYIINKIVTDKNKIKKPELSEEQLENIEKLVIISYTNQEAFHFCYFYSGKKLIKYGFVKEIDSIKKRILLNNGALIFFNQIISIRN